MEISNQTNFQIVIRKQSRYSIQLFVFDADSFGENAEMRQYEADELK